MAAPKVIVFGPTGAVGSATARTAEELGAKVVLAMRNPDKPVPGLDAGQKKQGNFERVQADLTEPDTVRNAVASTGAKRAFIYLAHGMPDSMKSTIEALKAAGIEMVVFLSSFTVQGDPKAIPRSEVISYIHAQVEINLEEIFGSKGFVTVRPGSFATNIRQYKAGVKEGKVQIYMPDAKVDCIVPEDIGRVCGTVLAKGPHDEERIMYLYGPELLSQRDAVKTLSKVMGKSPNIEVTDEQEAYRGYVEDRKVPPPVAKYMVSQAAKTNFGGTPVFGYPVAEDDLLNVRKYSGRKATTLEEWLQQNKEMFLD